MSTGAALATRQPSNPVHRLGRAGSVWAWRDWAYAGEDGTFGNRFDDAAGTFRVHYASSQRLGAFLETLARFRPDPHVLAATITEGDQDAGYPTITAGLVSERWLAERAISEATLSGTFVDIGHSATLAHLRTIMAARLLHFGLSDLDAATVRLHVGGRSHRRSRPTSMSWPTRTVASASTGSPTAHVSATTSRTGRSGNPPTRSPQEPSTRSAPMTQTSPRLSACSDSS
ncbi:MAG TPA: hypothetical protein VMU39_17445 [Solirubrobacteraceae bacterium]|nr:hypothetical protein [Solirubrobacteraceae bacterium]